MTLIQQAVQLRRAILAEADRSDDEFVKMTDLRAVQGGAVNEHGSQLRRAVRKLKYVIKVLKEVEQVQ